LKQPGILQLTASHTFACAALFPLCICTSIFVACTHFYCDHLRFFICRSHSHHKLLLLSIHTKKFSFSSFFNSPDFLGLLVSFLGAICLYSTLFTPYLSISITSNQPRCFTPNLPAHFPATFKHQKRVDLCNLLAFGCLFTFEQADKYLSDGVSLYPNVYKSFIFKPFILHIYRLFYIQRYGDKDI